MFGLVITSLAITPALFFLYLGSLAILYACVNASIVSTLRIVLASSSSNSLA